MAKNSLLLVGLLGLVGASLGFQQPLKPYRTLADKSNLKSAHQSEQFSIGDSRKPVFTWAPNHSGLNEKQTAYQVVVSTGQDEIVWDSGMVASAIAQTVYNGEALKGRTYYSWSVRFWDSKNISSNWSDASEFHVGEEIHNPTWLVGSDSDSLFRTVFKVPTDATRVTLYVCGLGYSYASINGKPASAQLLTTAPWTNNERRSAYTTFDITNITTASTSNVLGVALGNGWRDTSSFRRLDANESNFDNTTFKTFWAQVVVTTSAGTSTIVDTATSSFTSGRGPVTMDSVYNGETFDARMMQPGWDTLAFKPFTAWVAAKKNMDPPHGRLTAWASAPVLLDRIVEPVAINETSPGVFVVDFGINVAGVVKLSGIKLAKGHNVTLRHAEIMQHAHLPDVPNFDPKKIYTGNLRTAKATDVYIAAGLAIGETFYPRFTYHGFRFVEVTGLTALDKSQIEMHHFHSANDVKTTTNFNSPIIDRIMAMAVGSQRSNQMTLQTDCDQRDERLGWMGDANLSGDSLVLNFKYGAFLMDYLKTMIDELNADGSSVDTAPSVRYGGRPGDISWTTATIALPYAAFKGDGDLTPAKTYLDSLLLHLGNIAMQCKGNADSGCPTKYGDWVPPGAPGKGQGPKPSKPYTSAFSYIDAVAKIGELAKAIGNTSVADQMASEHTRLAATFNKAFYQHNNSYDNGVMTTFTLPLHLGIVPDGAKAAVQKNLLDQVTTKFTDHNMCGIIGMKFLFEQLAAMGREDTALAVLEGTSYPSIGFMAYNSYEKATENVWELWDAYTEGVGMNSRNHHMFSSYSKYLIEHVAGLTSETNYHGEHQITLQPAKALGVSESNTTSKLNHGDVTFAWQRSGGLQCAKAPEGEVAEVSCGVDGGLIKTVRFASYGRPFGTCGSFGADTKCHTSVVDIVSKLCVGQSECSLSASSLTDVVAQCLDTERTGELNRLYIEVECDTSVTLHVTATVPVTSRVKMHLPTTGLASPKLLFNSADASEYVTSTTVDENNRPSLVVEFTSGAHSFTFASTEPTTVVEAAAVGNKVSVACPLNQHISHVRFASFGNPVTSKTSTGDVVYTRGSCHVGSAITDAERTCLGQKKCDVVIETARLGAWTDCVTAESALVLQVECATSIVA